MKNKKGFTLVELLAVIVLLGVLVAIAVPSVLGISKKIKENMYDAKIKTIEVAAEAWVDDNKSDCKANVNNLTVTDLVNQGYLKTDSAKGEVLNPKDNTNWNNTSSKTLLSSLGINISCPNVNSVEKKIYVASKDEVEKTKENIKDIWGKASDNAHTYVENYCPDYKRCSLSELIDQGYFDAKDFSNLPDKSTVDDYRVNKKKGIYRYRYEYLINLYKNNQKYDSITFYIDDDNASDSLNVSIPNGYKYYSTTCEHLYYDPNYLDFQIYTSSMHDKNVVCDIYFVPGIATKNY